MNKNLLASWRTNFLTGLAIVLPAVVSVVALAWLFGTISGVTDALLFFLPHEWTHKNGGAGGVHWYWSLAAFVLAVVLISVVGLAARNYFGKKIIQWVDLALLRVPLLNKIYGTTKQVNEAFTSGSKGSFKTVVLIEFPRQGMYTLGFITSEEHAEVRAKTNQNVVCIFVPTTPNPTSGFLVLVPEEDVTKLEMSVADGIKYIISLGSITPGYSPLPEEASRKVAGLRA